MKTELSKIRECQRGLTNTYITLSAKAELLRPLMQDRRIAAHYQTGHLPRARNLLISALYLDCVLEALSITCDKDGRVASMANVLRMLRDPPLRATLRSEFAAVPDPLFIDGTGLPPEASAHYREREVSRFAGNFDAKLSACEHSFDRLQRSIVTQRLKGVRDKVHAHKEITSDGGTPRLRTIEEFGLRVRDIYQFLSRVRPMVLDLELLVTGCSLILDDIEDEHVVMARHFWSVTVRI